jgi:hypothetical protein
MKKLPSEIMKCFTDLAIFVSGSKSVKILSR